MDYTLLSDEDLADRVAARDMGALDALYARHARIMFSLALKLLGEREQAEEMVQEGFLKLWRRPDAYSRARGRLVPWLLGVVHHAAVDILRHRRIESRHHSTAEPDNLEDTGSEVDPEAIAWQSDRSAAIGRALIELPDPQRRVLELAYYRGLSQSEIAACLGVPLGTIKTRMRLALHKLRDSAEMQALRATEEV